MKIDACAFLGESIYRNSVTVEMLKSNMKSFGVDLAIVRPLKPCDYNYDRANSLLADTVAKNPELIGFGRVNPWEKDAPKQVENAKRYNLKGIHLNPWEDNFVISHEMVFDTIEAAKEAGFPVYVSTGYPCVSEPLQLLELALQYPEVTFIATHGAQLDMSGLSFDDALVMAEEAKNVKYDLSGVYRRDFIEKLIQTSGEKNVLFGSCTPYMDLSLEIERINAAQIPDEQKELIFSMNISKIINL